ncbi:MAG: hypothetical protein HFH41_04825 [Lachnospiraceae bacterium]|nr:hypothetical protein [Lachnospiraceae bacterium]
MKIGKRNLVIQLQLHNEKAVEFLIMEHGERLISIIRKHLFTLPHLQQECFLDTITAIWDHIDSFEDTNEFENWIGSVARYRCLEFLRSHQREATIPWLIEKEIAEEKEMMVSYLEEEEQTLFYRFYAGDIEEKTGKKEKKTLYRDMYDLLNRIDTDIFEYERERITPEEKEYLLGQLSSMLKKKKYRFSLRNYIRDSFQRLKPMISQTL